MKVSGTQKYASDCKNVCDFKIDTEKYDIIATGDSHRKTRFVGHKYCIDDWFTSADGRLRIWAHTDAYRCIQPERDDAGGGLR